ncbi:MAG TPA: Rieske 2Fe-2S domain-containing protein [Candidatus Cybelea sp.]|jgi:ubiquinol-cytochrome c reductase iron-sulfur subunit
MNRERWIAVALLVAIAGSAGFIAAYATNGGRLPEGLALAVAAAGLCAAAIGWERWILPSEQVTDELETYPSPAGERATQSDEAAAAAREVTRPRALLALLYVALGTFAAALVVPIRSLGPAPGDALFKTRWHKGARLAREDGSLVHVDDLNVDSAVTIFPEHALGDAQSQAMLIRLPDGFVQSANGYIAYSKVCTHAGCPVALYRAEAKQLLCPCHQSVFDVLAGGAVLSGPADHALPRLPLEIGVDGILRAAGDFPAPVGPGFWERKS